MSQFIRHLNQIKSKRTVEWLTPSQQAALSSIRNALRIPATVNLFGRAGVGKTFLGWTLASELDFAYLPQPDLINTVNGTEYDGVILDNCRAERQAHRELLKTLRFQDVGRAVIITRQTVQDYTHFVELHLTTSDILTAQQNLTGAGVLSIHRYEVPNLWYLVNLSL